MLLVLYHFGFTILLVNNGDTETAEITRRLNNRTLSRLSGKLSRTLTRIMDIIEGEKFDIQVLINQLCVVDHNKNTVFSTDDAFQTIQSYRQLSHQIGKYCTIYDTGELP